MTREKKKLTFQELEEHVVYWATERLEEFSSIASKIYHDTSIPDDEKEFIYNGIAGHISNLMDLMVPLSHDEEDLLLWASEFVDEYATYNKDVPDC